MCKEPMPALDWLLVCGCIGSFCGAGYNVSSQAICVEFQPGRSRAMKETGSV